MDRTKLIIIAILAVIAIIAVIMIIKNIKKNKIDKIIEDIETRFNVVKSAPIAFKLSKAQAMAKRNEETSSKVNEYYQKYEKAQTIIDFLQDKIDMMQDVYASKKYKEVKNISVEINERLIEAENQIKEIDDFLNQFQYEEKTDREYSQKLKERFREFKLFVEKNRGNYGVSIDGVEEKISMVEEMFSSSEEWMYANDFDKSKEVLEKIDFALNTLADILEEIPDQIALVKGLLPSLIDKLNSSYALSKQRNIRVDQLEIDSKMAIINANLQLYHKSLISCTPNEITRLALEDKNVLTGLIDELEKENEAYDNLKEIFDNTKENLNELTKVYEYVSKTYKECKEKFGLEDLKEYLTSENDKLKKYLSLYEEYKSDYANGRVAATKLLELVNGLYNESEIERKSLLTHKMKIDQTTFDEDRTNKQLQKLQVVVNEIEIKVKEYRLPSISEGYYNDLKKSKEMIEEVKLLLKGIPIDIVLMNKKLEDAISFIYTFYNNVNNIVGMAIMVENAIVFGNKFRSSYQEVDRELNKAEFHYLNGEYTKALKTAISCMESLFPNVKDSEILENE